ncbi:hypothetical protein, partial [Crocosphaera sp.]|uniref:hypothetical protein n=1 Tax=Crocosphaera sp. TaxID=2729996 RepID=UPI003F274FCC
MNSSESLKSDSQSFKLINTELTPEAEQKLKALEPILQASNKQQRSQAIAKAAETLGKSPRTIR